MVNADTKVIKTDENEFFCETNASNIRVERFASHSQPDHLKRVSSSKIKLKNIVDYQWETKEYVGRLLTAHIGGDLIAYSLKVNIVNAGKGEGMIRVVNVETGHRCLIKGMASEALDLEFAHVKTPVLLAYIDETSLYVQKIVNTGDKVVANLVFNLVDPLKEPFTNYKITWCPFVPESKFDSDPLTSQLLVWSRGSIFQFYSINDLMWKLGAGPHKPEGIKTDSLVFKGLRHNITDIVFSPDGSTLAVCTEDGLVQFFQIYLHSADKAPRVLHEWKPHNGTTVDRILFLDNLTESTADESLWQYAITCAHSNTELKLWNCENWECMQTIKFQSSEVPLRFKASLDETASYLVLSDMENLELFVLNIEKATSDSDSKGSTPSDSDKVTPVAKTSVKSILKFNLASPILSFQVTYVALKRVKHPDTLNAGYIVEEFEEYDEDANVSLCVVLQMFSVQPKSVQKCYLFHQPTAFSPPILEITENEEVEEPPGESTKEAISAKSSPSREVENILSFNKEIDDVFDTIFDAHADLETQAELEKEEEEEEDKERCEIVTSDEAEVEPVAEWPAAPSVALLNSIEHFSPQEIISNIKPNEILLNNVTENGAVSDIPDLSNDLVNDQIHKMMATINKQSLEISELRSGIKQIMLQTKQRENTQENLLKTLLQVHQTTQEELQKLASQNRKEKEFGSIERLLEKFTVNTKFQLETSLKDSLSKQIESQISTILTKKLDSILEKHMVKSNQELLKQTQTNELLLNLNKNQIFNDALGKSISTQLKPIIERAFASSVTVSMIPAFENLMEELFRQHNKIYTSGMKEYTSLLEKQIHQLKYSEEQQNLVVKSVQVLPEQILKRLDEIKATNAAQITQTLSKDLKVVQINLMKGLQAQIKFEVEKGFKDQATSLQSTVLSAVRSQAQTPVPTVQDTKQKITQLLKQGQINEAFHSALIANDLSLVNYTLEKANFSQVFNPCLLDQTVLLSLIQHLSADMSNHNELNQKYLSEAIMNLDLTTKVTKEHAPKILNELRKECRAFLRENPSGALNSAVKMLLMASQGVESTP